MGELEQVSALIGDIYDAALDPKLWPSVFESTCKYVRAESGGLLTQGTAVPGNIFFDWGCDPKYTQSYLNTYGRLNPLIIPMMLYARVGSAVGTSDLIPYDEIVTSRFHREWAAPQRFIDAIVVMIEKSATSSRSRSNACGY